MRAVGLSKFSQQKIRTTRLPIPSAKAVGIKIPEKRAAGLRGLGRELAKSPDGLHQEWLPQAVMEAGRADSTVGLERSRERTEQMFGIEEEVKTAASARRWIQNVALR